MPIPFDSPYQRLARTLDELPSGFPPAADGAELRLLAKIFTPEEAALAAELRADAEPPAEIAVRLGKDLGETLGQLKAMAQKGLIAFGKTAQNRPGFRLLPFIVGIYENQVERIDAEMAALFEAYYRQTFGQALRVEPQFHRVIPVGETIKTGLEVRPFESVTGLIDRSQAWGVIDCICRVEKALAGEPCRHPIDVCMVLSSKPGAFDGDPSVRALTREEAHATLGRAAAAGLVHCVSNHRSELWYICNCCTCSCGILRGMAELGIANAVARSAFVNQVDEALCITCGACVDACPFQALSFDDVAHVNEMRCVGCGVCVPSCPQGALGLDRRPGEALPPADEAEWRAARSSARRTPAG